MGKFESAGMRPIEVNIQPVSGWSFTGVNDMNTKDLKTMLEYVLQRMRDYLTFIYSWLNEIKPAPALNPGP